MQDVKRISPHRQSQKALHEKKAKHATAGVSREDSASVPMLGHQAKVWVAVGICMTGVIAVWVWGLNITLRKNSEQQNHAGSIARAQQDMREVYDAWQRNFAELKKITSRLAQPSGSSAAVTDEEIGRMAAELRARQEASHRLPQ